MSNVAILIPVKEKSLRLPGKWKQKLPNGNTLLEEAIIKAKKITDNVFVSSSSELILSIARGYSVFTIKRSVTLDGEVPLAEVTKRAIKLMPDNIERVVLLQITNPLVTVADLEMAVRSDCMAVTHCGAFYSQSKEAWLERGLENKQGNLGFIYMEKSVDIDDPNDFNKAYQLLEK